jgi:hypothetical protein
MKMLCEVPFKDKTITALDVSDKKLGVEGALVVAEYLDGNGALLVLSLKSNNLQADGGKALAGGLKGNQRITELNIASNNLSYNADVGADMSGVIVLADTIPYMGALLSLDMSNNQLNKWRNRGMDCLGRGMDCLGPAVASSTITSLNIANNHLHQNSGIDAVVSMLDNGALTKLTLKDNRLATAEAGKILSDMLAANTVLKELDVSSNCWDLKRRGGGQAGGDGPEFAKEISKGLSDNGTLTSLDISSNNLIGGKGTGGFETVAAEYSDESDEEEEIMEPDFSGIIAIANAIPDMGALIKLNIGSNHIGAEQERDLQRICVAGGIELAK